MIEFLLSLTLIPYVLAWIGMIILILFIVLVLIILLILGRNEY